VHHGVEGGSSREARASDSKQRRPGCRIGRAPLRAAPTPRSSIVHTRSVSSWCDRPVYHRVASGPVVAVALTGRGIPPRAQPASLGYLVAVKGQHVPGCGAIAGR